MDEDWHAICQAVFQGVDGSEWDTHNEPHQAVNCKTSGENKKAKALWALKDAKGQRNSFFYDLGSVAANSNKIPSQVGSLRKAPEEPDGCSGKRIATYSTKMSTGPVISIQRCVMSEAFGSLLFGLRIACQQCMLEEMSSDEDAAHNIWSVFLEGLGQSRPGHACGKFL